MACSHRRRDETRQFCLVSNCVHTADKTVLSRLDPVSMSPRWRCEHNWRRDKTVLSCRVGGVSTTADRKRQFCLVRVGGVNSPLRDSLKPWSHRPARFNSTKLASWVTTAPDDSWVWSWLYSFKIVYNGNVFLQRLWLVFTNYGAI